MARSSKHYYYDPEFDPEYLGLRDGDDPDYPFRDTRPLHWRYPELEERYPDRGQINMREITAWDSRQHQGLQPTAAAVYPLDAAMKRKIWNRSRQH